MLLELFLLLLNLGLLLFDRVEHGPKNWIVIHEQIAIGVRGDSFGNDLLHGLRAKADMFAFGLNAERVVALVFVAQRLQLQRRFAHLAGRRATSVESIEKALELFPGHQEIATYGALILGFNHQADRAARLAQDLVRRATCPDIAAAVHDDLTIASNGQPIHGIGCVRDVQDSDVCIVCGRNADTVCAVRGEK